MQRPGAPAGFLMLGEMVERDGEDLAGAREVGRRAGGSEKHGDVVEKPSLGLLGLEGEHRESRPELVGEHSRRALLLSLGQLLLDTKPIAVSGDRVREERVREVSEQLGGAVRTGQGSYDRRLSGVGVQVTAGR